MVLALVTIVLILGAQMLWAKEKLVFWTMWTGDPRFGVQVQWARDFEKLHPDVEIEVQAVPWGESYPKYQAAMAGHTLPDLGVLWPEFAVQIGSAGFVYPVNELLDEIGRDNIYQNLIDVHTFKGKTYAAPHVNYNQVLFVRGSYLKEAGYGEPPERGWTWEQLTEIAKKMTKDTDGDGQVDRWGIGGEIVNMSRSHGTDHAVAMALGRHGIHYKDEKGNVTFDTPETIKAVKEISDMFLVHKVMPPGTPGYDPEWLQLYQTGKIGMFGASSGNYARIEAQAPDVFKDTVLSVLPTGPAGGANWISPDGIGIFKESKHIKTASEFIKFYLQDDNIRLWAKTTRGLCATKSGNEDPFFQKPIFQVQERQIRWGWGVRYNGVYVSPSDGELDGQFIFSEMMQNIISKGMSVEEAVKKAADAIKRLPSIKM
ncbi:MAG: ABC transporter substrate-binding protein [bacterium]